MAGSLSEWGARNVTPRDENDDYPTPPSFTKALVDREEFDAGPLWDPAAGAGHLVHALRELGLDAYGTDLLREENHLRTSPADFLEYNGPQVPYVVTNPPYKHANAFAFKALEVATDKVCFLMKTSFLEGITRYTKLFAERPPSRLYLTTRKMVPAGYKSGLFSHVWVVWDLTEPRDGELDVPTDFGWFTPEGSLEIPTGEPGA